MSDTLSVWDAVNEQWVGIPAIAIERINNPVFVGGPDAEWNENKTGRYIFAGVNGSGVNTYKPEYELRHFISEIGNIPSYGKQYNFPSAVSSVCENITFNHSNSHFIVSSNGHKPVLPWIDFSAPNQSASVNVDSSSTYILVAQRSFVGFSAELSFVYTKSTDAAKTKDEIESEISITEITIYDAAVQGGYVGTQQQFYEDLAQISNIASALSSI